MASKETNQLLAAAVAACEDKKAEDIRILKLDPSESGLSDYFLICNGTNDRQNVAITDEIEIRLKRDFGTYPNSVEGRRQGDWVLMDYVDFIVHVFSAEKRAFYGLERLRKSATSISIDDLNAEVKAALVARRAPKKGAAAPSAAPAVKKTATKPVAAAAPKSAASKSVASKSVASKTTAKKPAATETATKTAAKAASKTAPEKPTAKPAAKPAATPPSKPTAQTPGKVAAKKSAEPAKKSAAKKATAPTKPAKKAASKVAAKKAR